MEITEYIAWQVFATERNERERDTTNSGALTQFGEIKWEGEVEIERSAW